MRVRIHYNLQRGDWVVTSGGKVLGYCDACQLTEVTTHLSPSTKARGFFNNGGKPKRTVHLWAEGILSDVVGLRDVRRPMPEGCEEVSPVPGFLYEVTYNPFKHEGFVYRDSLKPWTSGRVAVFGNDKTMRVG